MTVVNGDLSNTEKPCFRSSAFVFHGVTSSYSTRLQNSCCTARWRPVLFIRGKNVPLVINPRRSMAYEEGQQSVISALVALYRNQYGAQQVWSISVKYLNVFIQSLPVLAVASCVWFFVFVIVSFFYFLRMVLSKATAHVYCQAAAWLLRSIKRASSFNFRSLTVLIEPLRRT